ncbi:MAG: oxaloacetate decarboxylase [Halobacteriales archaeon]|nr:oxaloacetate decarboxylase [Halobacteriales archaeon]
MDDRHNRLRELLDAPEIAVLPGCYDALSAKIVEKAGFDAVYLSGAGVSNTKLGLADLGLTTLTEMVERVGEVAGAVSVPVVSDADTGYGNPLHVRRTVELYERAGASALHLEDQSFPKKCGHFDDKRLVPADELIRKVEAAVDARHDSGFTIIARTDARAVEGIDAAIERSNAYADAGADLIFPEAPQSKEEMARFCDEIDAPVMANMVEDGKTPLLSADELGEIGYDLVIFPNSLLRGAMTTMVELAGHLRETGSTLDVEDRIANFELRNDLTDYERLRELEARYSN